MLKVFNTQTRQKEELRPLTPDHVKIYVCGVTTYDVCHLGHARAAVAFDVAVRHLRRRFKKVTFVRNITDIDDKIINRAAERGVAWDEHARHYTDLMHRDFAALGILPPDIEPKATDHVPEMIALIEALIQKGLAYASEGDVFFSVRKLPGYGKLSGKSLDDLQAGARVAIDEKKQDALDFALWKRAKPGEPTWESPWGAGRPGWHIECSAMAQKYLGQTLDLHGGGRDLIFPHHENEIAQSEGASGKPFVNCWLHNGFVTIDKQKMSKSAHNFFSIEDILKLHHPEAVRLFLLSSHYRGPIDYADEHLKEAHGRLERIYQFKARLLGLTGAVEMAALEADAAVLIDKVNEALDDDFNTPMAVAAVFEFVRKTNIFLDQNPDGNRAFGERAVKAVNDIGAVLGVFQLAPQAWLQRSSGVDAAKIEALIAERNAARKAKNFKRGDEIRDELLAQNIVLEDTAKGTVWKRK